MLLEQERHSGLGMDALVTRITRTSLWFGHGCCGVTVCSWNKNVIMVWAWMRRSRYAPETRALLCFARGMT